MSDDGFHEIQLNGKQLIFLSMTAALILVVAFLTGVLVGRGVQARKDTTVAADVVPAAPAAGDTAPLVDATASQAPAAPPVNSIAPPTPADEDLSYNSRLEDQHPPAETLAPQGTQAARDAAKKTAGTTVKDTSRPGATAAAELPPANAPAKAGAETATAKVDASLPAEPRGSGYYLKIVAYRDRAQAAAMARRLGSKGYATYIVPLSGRGPVLYSVRVGKYKTRREADSIRRRLEKEEQLKPLISH